MTSTLMGLISGRLHSALSTLRWEVATKDRIGPLAISEAVACGISDLPAASGLTSHCRPLRQRRQGPERLRAQGS